MKDSSFKIWQRNLTSITNFIKFSKRLPLTNVEEFMYWWLARAKRQYKKNELEERQLVLLKGQPMIIEFLNSHNYRSFLGKFKRLKEFIKENKSLPPQTRKDDTGLRKWLYNCKSKLLGGKLKQSEIKELFSEPLVKAYLVHDFKLGKPYDYKIVGCEFKIRQPDKFEINKISEGKYSFKGNEIYE